MKRIFSSLTQGFCQRIFALGLMLLISLSSSFFFVQQPGYAAISPANQLTPENKVDRAYEYGEAAGFEEQKREDAYEKAIKDSESPQTLEKAYERNLKAEKVQEPNILEKAEELIQNVTGK
ncbi:MAG: hypothetical protein DSM106950_16825 [Stigonema ocellatum SAG 48.90 = DSM 106950]|nr:hypothetical protein [Stigonema ocellatum SAG 48.90 = DSM 106950]